MRSKQKYAVHVMGMDSTKYGGIERFNVALSKALEDEGIQSVFVYESIPKSTLFVCDLEQTGAELLISDSRKHPLRFCLQFIRIINKYKPVIVHSHFTKARFYAIPIARLLGVHKLFFTIHSRMDPIVKIKFLTRLWYRMANRMAKVIVVSDDIALSYRTNWLDANVKRIYLGVSAPMSLREVSRVRLGIPDGQTVLLTIANFNYIKGLDVLSKAVALLKKEKKWGKNVCLYIVGQPQKDLDELSSINDSIGIGQDVKLIGISNDVSDYMSAADIYIQPSRSEGLPLALMEAASYSLPLIGSNVGGIPEIIKDRINGILASPEDERNLADAISELINDKGLRVVLGNNSFSIYRESFSIENSINQTLNYYFT